MLALLAWSAFASAQVAPPVAPAAPYTLKLKARTVTLDVVVTDKKGQVVKNLEKNDFSVFDHGLEQTVDYFRASQPNADSAHAVPASRPGRKDETSGAPVTILVLDELSMGFEDEAFASYSLRRFLARQGEALMQPTMLLSAKLGKLEVLSDYTRSKDSLLKTLDHRFTAYPWPTRSGNLVDDQINTSLSALVALAESTAGQPGRKNVIWIGRGFPTVTPGSLDPASAASLQSALRTCIDLMMQARMTLSTIDPGGLSVNPTVDDDGNVSSDPFAGQVDFSAIARSTGGETFAGKNDVDKLIELCSKEADNFYTLAYTPDAASADEQRFHSIRVVMKNPEWKATTRSGYYPDGSAGPASGQTAQTEMDRSLYDLDVAARTTLLYEGVPMQIARSASGPDLFTIAIPVSAIPWQDAAHGERTAAIDLLAESFDRNNTMVEHTAKRVDARLASGSTVSQVNILVRISSAPPAVRLRMVVRLASNGRVGADNFNLARGEKP